ncbi:hypothetical protein BDE40_1151 [Litoreibacter halocynthiae]|uniref:Uncharacterized protein n=1 Tax=Litoreibacter halocynthiae TaxID=1242689 RepID=A0A4R7LSP5_9RHOB|nr:hypothetical protein [Litoreibacter halocynthiae]TDT77852.1 hypothetical protein BDE40_1151 [Litoreibacter halocynthiae]
MLELRPSVNRLWPNIRTAIGFIVLAFAGCSPSAPSHLPNPVLLPAYAVGNAIHNASYNARRAKVKTYVAQNFEALNQDLRGGGGPVLEKAYRLAGIKAETRPALTHMLAKEPNLAKDPEALTVSLMVHGD